MLTVDWLWHVPNHQLYHLAVLDILFGRIAFLREEEELKELQIGFSLLFSAFAAARSSME